MSYEYHKHPKKNWGQPPAFRLPHADRTGSEKTDVPSPILNKRTVHVHMRQGGTGWYSFFPVFSFRGREHVGFGIPFLHGMRLLQVSLDFQGGVSAIFLHSLLFAPLQPFLFSFGFALLSRPTPEREVGRLVAKRTGTNGDELPGSQSLARWCRSCGLVSSGLERTQPHLYVVVVVDISVGTQGRRHLPDGAAGWSRLGLVKPRE